MDTELNQIIEDADEIMEIEGIFIYKKGLNSYILDKDQTPHKNKFEVYNRFKIGEFIQVGNSRNKSNLGLIDSKGYLVIDTMYSEFKFLNNQIIASKYALKKDNSNDHYNTEISHSDTYNLHGKKIEMPNLINVTKIDEGKFLYAYKNNYGEVRDTNHSILKKLNTSNITPKQNLDVSSPSNRNNKNAQFSREQKINRGEDHYLVSTNKGSGDTIYVMGFGNASFDETRTIYEKVFGIANSKNKLIVPIEFDEILLDYHFYIATKSIDLKQKSFIYNLKGDLLFATDTHIKGVLRPSDYISRKCYFHGTLGGKYFIYDSFGNKLNSTSSSNNPFYSNQFNKNIRHFRYAFFTESNALNDSINLLNRKGEIILKELNKSDLSPENFQAINFKDYVLLLENTLIFINEETGIVSTKTFDTTIDILPSKISTINDLEGMILLHSNNNYFYYNYITDILFRSDKN